MSRPDFERASEIEWEEYYRAVEGRPLRPLFAEALPFLPTQMSGGHPLVAVDLGCGDGTETFELLRSGWTVFAVDQEPGAIDRVRESVPPGDRQRLSTSVASFSDLDLPTADLVYAGLSLPFCPPGDFDEVWARVTSALRSNGLFVGHLFGMRDSWAGTPDMTFHTREDVDGLLTGFEILGSQEQDEDGEAVSGPKHWHVFHVIARRRSREPQT